MPPALETVPLGWATAIPIKRSRSVPGAVAQRSPATSGDQPADCRVRAAGRIERQALPMLGQDRLNIAEPGPGAYREDEIGRLVVDDARQAFGREDAVDALRRISQVQRGAAADRADRAAHELAASARASATSWPSPGTMTSEAATPSMETVPDFRLAQRAWMPSFWAIACMRRARTSPHM